MDSGIYQALVKVRTAIQRAVSHLRHNGVRSLLDHSLYEIMVVSKEQLRLLPELELRIGDDLTVKFRMALRTFTLAKMNVRRSCYSVDRLAR